MPGYAELPDVRARLGRLAAAFTDQSHPGEADILRFVDDRGLLLDGVLAEYGTVPLAAGSTAALALRPMTAIGAALDAIDAAWPGGEGAPEVAGALRKSLHKAWDAAWKTIADRTHPAILVLRGADPTQGATALWTSEPTLELTAQSTDAVDVNPELAPAISRRSAF